VVECFAFCLLCREVAVAVVVVVGLNKETESGSDGVNEKGALCY
jgi:hypothetical protein